MDLEIESLMIVLIGNAAVRNLPSTNPKDKTHFELAQESR